MEKELKPSKPSLEQAMALLWHVASQVIQPVVLEPEELDCAKFLESLGLIEVLPDEDAVSHRARVVAVCKCHFNCGECANYNGEKLHEWKTPSGEVMRYANPIPFCRVFGFIMSGTFGKGLRCGRFMPKALMEALGRGS